VRALFFGPPGSGKGTQATRLAAERSLVHLSSGDLLRAAAAKGTPLGREAKGYMDRGELVPDDLVVGLLLERLEEMESRRGFVLDGFPRNRLQAEALEGRLGREGRSALDVALEFLLGDEDVVDRMSGRRSCSGCGTPYHVRFSPPRVADRCDRCGRSLVGRSDDAPAVVRGRLQVYRRDADGLRSFYRSLGCLREVDASGTIDEVARFVTAVLDEEGVE